MSRWLLLLVAVWHIRISEYQKGREMTIGFVLFLVAAAATLAHGQRQTGFISIDCGSPPNFQYQDTDTGISYASDEGYIESGIGINRNISSEYTYPINPNLPLPLSDLRSFPHGISNCYSLKPSSIHNGFVGTSLNLIRASFLYGNYDGLNHLPQFDLYLGVNLWATIKFQSASHIVTTEIITGWPISSHTNTIHVCLINKRLGTPFISALELRPLNSSIYSNIAAAAAVPSYSSSSLLLFQRLDIGQSNNGTATSIRYEDDIYDRTWSSYSYNMNISTAWDTLITSQPINNFENGYRVPYQVIRTAAKPRNINNATTLELNWTSTSNTDEFYIYMYFAEVEQLGGNQSRKFNVSWNGNPLFGPFSPRYLYATVLSNSRALVGKQHRISIYKTEDSTHPPILNAIEIYRLKHMDQLPTYTQDVDAIMDIKTTYQINKNWGGDPCGPKNLSWQGLKCSYNNNISNASFPPRIVSLNLTWSNLSGTIAASISKLSLLEFLDLSNNNLTGSVPGFLEDLKSLKFMNLKGNQLSGSVPSALLKRSEAGLLTLSVDGRNLCGSGSCKRKKNVVVPIVASLMSSAVVVLTVVVIIVWKMRRKRKSKAEKKGNKTVALKKLQYSKTEVLQITNDFQRVIGKGGFGTVYHGYLKDGNQVAVKILSPSSSQGPKEFKTEAELLMRVHHRNLASFVGYCDDADHLALIYDYMPNGNLKDYLSDASLHLNWETRLRIAVDAAQGLEYLHHGCKPPIVHRDVKTANILLTKNLDAKIADFGLSKVFPSDHDTTSTAPVLMETSVMGTAGYLDPEYYNSHMLNEKSDVYSFGVVLLELITGQTAVIKSEERMHIIHWLVPELQRGDIRRIVDPRLQVVAADDDHEYHFEVNSVLKALQVAMACTTSTSHQRPTMDRVVAELKQCLDIILTGSSTTWPPPPSSTATITEEMNMITSSYTSSSDIPHDGYSTLITDSINAESMTAPFAR